MWGAGWGYWGWGWWFWVFWVVVLILCIGGLASLPWGRQTNVPPEEQILRERYARGEISKEEFDQRLDDLRRAA
jgi:putative membrane protein